MSVVQILLRRAGKREATETNVNTEIRDNDERAREHKEQRDQSGGCAERSASR